MRKWGNEKMDWDGLGGVLLGDEGCDGEFIMISFIVFIDGNGLGYFGIEFAVNKWVISEVEKYYSDCMTDFI